MHFASNFRRDIGCYKISIISLSFCHENYVAKRVVFSFFIKKFEKQELVLSTSCQKSLEKSPNVAFF